MSAAETPVIRATAMSRRFGSRSSGHLAVDSVEIAVDSSTSLGIVGESGSGKSTLSRLLCGLDDPSEGRVTFDGRELREIRRDAKAEREFRRLVQFVGQDTTAGFDPRRTLLDSVSFPARRLLGLGRGDAEALAEATFAELGLDAGLASRRPHAVSGGQRQRFALARALVVRPRILICDEVVSALDVSVQGTILNFLKRYCREHRAGLVFVSHGLPATAFLADELAVMFAGRIVERASSREMVRNPQHEYTRGLFAAHRELGEGLDVPSPAAETVEKRS